MTNADAERLLALLDRIATALEASQAHDATHTPEQMEQMLVNQSRMVAVQEADLAIRLRDEERHHPNVKAMRHD